MNRFARALGVIGLGVSGLGVSGLGVVLLVGCGGDPSRESVVRTAPVEAKASASAAPAVDDACVAPTEDEHGPPMAPPKPGPRASLSQLVRAKNAPSPEPTALRDVAAVDFSWRVVPDDALHLGGEAALAWTEASAAASELRRMMLARLRAQRRGARCSDTFDALETSIASQREAHDAARARAETTLTNQAARVSADADTLLAAADLERSLALEADETEVSEARLRRARGRLERAAALVDASAALRFWIRYDLAQVLDALPDDAALMKLLTELHAASAPEPLLDVEITFRLAEATRRSGALVPALALHHETAHRALELGEPAASYGVVATLRCAEIERALGRSRDAVEDAATIFDLVSDVDLAREATDVIAGAMIDVGPKDGDLLPEVPVAAFAEIATRVEAAARARGDAATATKAVDARRRFASGEPSHVDPSR